MALNSALKPFREFLLDDLDSHSVKTEMESRGYLFVRHLLPIDDVNRLLTEITQVVYAAGWLQTDREPIERIVNGEAACGDPEPSFKRVYEQVFNLESFHALAHHPALRRVMALLVGKRLLIHPKPIGRLIFPSRERFVVHEHQDHQAIGGDPETFTAWIPLHDCPPDSGPLQILESSHRFGLQHCDSTTGLISRECAQGGDWVGGQISAGDVLIFHSLTVHAGTRNICDKLRVSMDCRFQNYERPVNPATLVFVGSRSWENTYETWHSDELKYFWRSIPLQLKPSKLELAQLAETADAPEMRLRYAKILSRITSEMPD